MQGIPTVEDARAWLGVSSSAVSDDDLAQIHAAELVIQARSLAIPVDDPEAIYPEPLARSLLRRIGRECAAKGIPLGFVGGEASEFSPIMLSSWDSEVARLEATYVVPVIA
jgi:hypothetical protein